MSSTMTTTPWEQIRQESLAAMTETERAEYDAAAIEAEARLQLAELVYHARAAAGISQTELARRAGDAPVCHLRHRERRPGSRRHYARAHRPRPRRNPQHPLRSLKKRLLVTC